MKSTIRSLLMCSVFAVPASYAADDTYRSVMPDGSVRYGEAPEQGAKSFKKIPAPPASSGVVTITPQEQGRGAPPVREGSTVVFPVPERAPALPAEAGKLQAPQGLPKRTY